MTSEECFFHFTRIIVLSLVAKYVYWSLLRKGESGPIIRALIKSNLRMRQHLKTKLLFFLATCFHGTFFLRGLQAILPKHRKKKSPRIVDLSGFRSYWRFHMQHFSSENQKIFMPETQCQKDNLIAHSIQLHIITYEA